MMPVEEPRGLDRHVGSTVHSEDGMEIGRIDRFLPHRVTGLPTWIVLQSGFIAGETYVLPVAGCDFTEERIVTPYTQQRVENQPSVEIQDDQLSPEDETRLDEFYDLGAGSTDSGTSA